MSIRGNMQPYLLQEVVKIKDSLVSDILTCKDIATIGVTMSRHHKTNVTQDGLDVQTVTHEGITNYSMLDETKSYRLVGNNIYSINSFISGRWVQLQLKEVVTHE